VRAGALLLPVVAACWTNAPEPRTAPVATRDWHTEWRGSYVCAQGPTALHVVLDETCPPGATCEVAGVFEFGPTDANPAVPHGSFHVTGTIRTNDAGELVLNVSPIEWIDRPANYVSVGFTATSDRAHGKLRGTMASSWCGKLELTRQE
jgi:hypothetical protein